MNQSNRRKIRQLERQHPRTNAILADYDVLIHFSIPFETENTQKNVYIYIYVIWSNDLISHHHISLFFHICMEYRRGDV